MSSSPKSSPSSPTPRWISLEVAAQLTSPPIPVGSLRLWLSLGRLSRHRVGRRIYVDRLELEALLSAPAAVAHKGA